MKRIFLSLAALCCIVASSYAAVGDKIYFVNSLDWENLYVSEYLNADPWTTLVNSQAAVAEGWKYDNHDVYSYTIQNENVKIDVNDGTTWATSREVTAGRYYTVETGETKPWLDEKYYNEFYFMDNNGDYVFGATPNIALAKSDWTYLNGEWTGQAMTSIGTVHCGEADVDAYKYVYLTAEPVQIVQFLKSTDTDVKCGQDQALVADKNIYSNWGWHSLQEVANKIYLNYATDKDANSWQSDVEMPLNGEGKYTASISNFVVTEEGDYKFRAFLGSGSWAAPVTHPNAADWHESVHLTPGIYNLYYLYNPYDGTFTVEPTKQYNRTGLTSGNYGTICLPNASTYWEGGATFYTIAGKEDNSIVLEEVSNNWLQAGRPYIFQAAETWLTVWFNDETAAGTPWVDHTSTGTNGLVGSFTEQALADNAANLYVLSANEFHPVGENVQVGAYRAYLDMSAVSAAPAQAPGKRYVRVAVQGKMPTALENVQEAAQSTKVMENGVLYIIKNGVRYNAQGQIVK